MYGNSKGITSKRLGVHENLEKTVLKYLHTEFRRPFAEHTLTAFENLIEQWQAFSQQHNDSGNKALTPLILDACCGTARSTVAIAHQHPDSFIVGVDQSSCRLSKQHELPSNAIIIQANLLDLYRIMANEDIRLQKHFLLYPNPWPKQTQLKRRWHAMPCFPAMLKLGGIIEVRSNWDIYIEEFSFALNIAGFESTASVYTTDTPITAFEEKYLASGHQLYSVQCNLNP